MHRLDALPAAPCRNLLLLGAVGAPAVGLAGPYALFFVPPRCAAAMRRCPLALGPAPAPPTAGSPARLTTTLRARPLELPACPPLAAALA